MTKEEKSVYNKEWYRKNKTKKKEYDRKRNLINSEKNKEKCKQWHKENPDYNKQWHLDNPEYSKEYAEKNKDVISQKNKERYKNNTEYYIQKRKEWCLDNPDYNINRYSNKSEEWHVLNKERRRVYYNTHKEKEIQKVKEYRENNPEKIRLLKTKGHKRRKNWGIEPINNWFKNSHFHHLHVDGNHNIGIYVPAELHNSIWHSYKDQESMNKINKVVIEWYN